MDEKLKKSINISIQSKKYLNKINSILKEWNEEGLTPSNVICEDILLGYTISKSASLIKIVKLLEMIESILSINYKKDSVEYQLALEEILSKSINIDMSKINSMLISEIQNKSVNNLRDNLDDIKKEEAHKTSSNDIGISEESINKFNSNEDDDFLDNMLFNS